MNRIRLGWVLFAALGALGGIFYTLYTVHKGHAQRSLRPDIDWTQSLLTGEVKRLLDAHPHPVWICNALQKTLWSNTACVSLGPGLFDAARAPVPSAPHTHRICIETPSGKRWLDVDMKPVDGLSLYSATPADAEVHAEAARQQFVQTLTKTFGQLSTGLAIFDKNRNLSMFNPAILELSGLPFERLSSGPDLESFLDLLRERRVIPEPRRLYRVAC